MSETTEDVKYKDGVLASGTFEALLELFLPTAVYLPEKSFIFTFLLSGRLFIKPSQLLNELGQVSLYQDSNTEGAKQSLVDNVVTVLEEWILNFPFDFLDRKLLDLLKDICQNSVETCPTIRPRINCLTSTLLSKLSAVNEYEENVMKLSQDSALRLNHMPSMCDILDICPSSLTMAHQLTHIEFDRLCFISAEEFVQAFAKENTLKFKNIHKDTKRAKCLEAYVQWFNRLTYFAATEVCTHVKKKNRVKVLEYFIDVAKECFNIGNFNASMALIAGLNMSQVSRLKRTWIKVSNMDRFDVLEHQMDPTNNFGCYRSTLKAAIWRTQGATDQREKIVIPFFSLFLKDLYFLNECCASKLPGGQLNFEKFWQVAKQVSEFISWKYVECPFPRREPIIHYILTSPVFSEDALSMASYECESPDKEYEKMSHKQLKDIASRLP